MNKLRLRTLDNAVMSGIAGMVGYARLNTFDSAGNHMGTRLAHAVKFRDAAGRLRTYDSTGAFLVGELERLDPTLHQPLAAVTWGRDIDLRNDVTIADDVSSFTVTNFANPGNLGTGNGVGNGKSWMGRNSKQIAGVAVDIGKVPQPLHLWGQEISYSVIELESAARLGRPVDDQKFQALNLKHQMDIDEMVYIGDTGLGVGGLVNHALVTNVQNLPAGASLSTAWSGKTADEILADVNFMLTSVWNASAYAAIPAQLRIPPAQFGYISTQKVSSAGNISILKYILENNLLITSGRGTLDIQPVKWLVGAAAGGTIGVASGDDRAVVYTRDPNYVRYPMTTLQRTPLQFESIYHKTTYYCRLGQVEVVYPETIGYFDGL